MKSVASRAPVSGRKLRPVARIWIRAESARPNYEFPTGGEATTPVPTNFHGSPREQPADLSSTHRADELEIVVVRIGERGNPPIRGLARLVRLPDHNCPR